MFFDSASIITPNRNCNIENKSCRNRLYSQQDIKTILALKGLESFSRDDAFEFVVRLNEKFKSTCNRCYAGFTDSYMNEILIMMGFNPITRRTAVRSTWYNTSGFTMFVKRKFEEDKRIVELTKFVFDSYLKN